MKYQPTEQDRQTGRIVRKLRKRHGRTLQETVRDSGVGFGDSTLSKVELGQRPLTFPEAQALARYFGTTINELFPAQIEPTTEQEWLGNSALKDEETTGRVALFPLASYRAPDHIADETAYVRSRTLEINLDAPLSLSEYREQVWIPYLEQRYASDLKQTG